MCKRSGSTSAGEICVLFVLISASTLHLADATGATIEERQMSILEDLDRLSSVEDADKLLEAVEDKDDVKLFGVSVDTILSLKNNLNVDCRANKIEEDRDVFELFALNEGLSKFCDHYLTERIIYCVKKIAANLDAKAKKIAGTDRNVVKEFYGHLEGRLPDGKAVVEALEKYLDDDIFYKIGWKDSRRFRIEQLESSCKKVEEVLSGADSEYIWDDFDRWIRDNRVSCEWYQIRVACKSYVNNYSPSAEARQQIKR